MSTPAEQYTKALAGASPVAVHDYHRETSTRRTDFDYTADSLRRDGFTDIRYLGELDVITELGDEARRCLWECAKRGKRYIADKDEQGILVWPIE